MISTALDVASSIDVDDTTDEAPLDPHEAAALMAEHYDRQAIAFDDPNPFT